MPLIHRKNTKTVYGWILLGLLFCSSRLQAQTVVSGSIKDRLSGRPLSEVICTLSSLTDGSLLQYGITNAEGTYHLSLKHPADSLLLEAKILGFKSIQRHIPNRTQTQHLLLEEEGFQIREVVIKPEVITQQGDTIQYRVASFRSAKDTYIRDVIQKLPGVEVSESGKISYMGNPINKFYIEGMDLLGGKYALASNSIPVDAVESVQILENHQSVQALKEVSFTDRAALNLKIKQGKKLHPIGRVSAGIGFDEEEMKYTTDITHLRLKGERQNLTALKMNNLGRLLGSELMDHTYDYRNGTLLSPLSDIPFALVHPSLGYTPSEIRTHSVFNDSKSFSYNQILPLKAMSQLRIQASYLDEKTEGYQQERTLYGYSEENPREIVREQSSWQRTRQGNVLLNWTHNAEKRYLDNRLRIAGEWSEAGAQLHGTELSEQRFDQPYFLVENQLKAIGKWKKDYLTLQSFLRFHRLPQEARFDEATDSLIVQYRSEELFSTRNEISFNKGMGYTTFSLGAGVKAETNELHTDMRSKPALLKDSLVHSQGKYQLAEWYVNPSFHYKRPRFAFTLSLPFSGYLLKVKGQSEKKNKHHRYSFLPSSHLNWKLHPFWELSASASYIRQPSDYRNLNDCYYYINRSTLRHGNQTLEVKEQWRGRVNLSYRNALTALFSRLTFLYNRQSSNLLSGYDFVGSQVVRTLVSGQHRYTSYAVTAQMGKMIDVLQTNLSLTAGFTHTDFTNYQNTAIQQLTTQAGYVNLSSHTRFTRWWEGSLVWQSIGSHTRGGDTYWMHQLQINFTFSWDRWLSTLKVDYSSNAVSPTQQKQTAWLSAFLRYKLKKEIQLELAAENLLNTQTYRYRTIQGINQIDACYLLRPRQIVLKINFQY